MSTCEFVYLDGARVRVECVGGMRLKGGGAA